MSITKQVIKVVFGSIDQVKSITNFDHFDVVLGNSKEGNTILGTSKLYNIN